MARRFAIGNNLSGNWGTEHNSTTVNNANLSVNVAKQSTPFTASSTTDADVGMAFFVGDLGATYSNDRVWQIRLIENSSVVRSVDISIRHINSDEDGMVIIRWDTPYTYTSTTADYYWYEIVALSSSGAADRVMQDNASATNFAYIGFNDIGTTLSNNDSIFIPRGTVANIDNTSLTLGDGTATTYNSCNWNSAINICGALGFDDSTDTSLNIRGNIAIECGGMLGHETNILSNNHAITFDYITGTSGDYGIFTRQICEIHLLGTHREHMSMYSSGIGTTTSPLFILDDLSLQVNDYICISATSAVLETEYKYIISGTHSSGFVLSDSVGGAESGLINTHSVKAIIGSLTRNISITTTDVSFGWFFDENKQMSDDYNIHNSEFCCTFISRILNFDLSSATFTNCVIYETVDSGYVIAMRHKQLNVHEHNIFAKTLNQTGGGDYLFTLSSASGQQVKNSLFISIQVNAWQVGGYNNGLLNCKLVDCNTDNDSNGGVIRTVSSIKNYLRGCYFDAIRSQVIRIRSNTDLEIESCVFGDELPTPVTFRNDLDIYTWNIMCSNSTFNDNALGLNIQGGLSGSQMRFHYCNLPGFTSNFECITYDTNGIYQKCGVGLNDTTNRTTGNHSFALKPYGTLQWEFNSTAKVNDGVLMSGYFKTVNFVDGDLFKVELFLPGSTTPDSEMERMSGFDYDWVNGFVTAYYNGVLPQNAKIVITARSYQTDAAVYCADLLNGENDITGLNVWDKAFPSNTMYNLSLSPMEVWGMLGSVPVPTGSYGELITNSIYNGEVILDTSSTHAGTGWGIGTKLTPVNNLTDALLILDRIASSTIKLSGTLVLDQDVSGLEFISHRNGKIDLNNQTCMATRFRDLKVYGVQSTLGLFYNCRISSLEQMQGVYEDCRFLCDPGTSFSSGTTHLINPVIQGATAYDTQEFNLSNGGNIIGDNVVGRIKFQNCTTPSTVCSFNYNNGMITLDSTLTHGVFVNIGIVNVTDNSTGATTVVTQQVAMQTPTNNMIIANS